MTMDERTAMILETIRALPAQTLTTTIRSPRGEAVRTFKGALLLDYAAAAGLIPRATGLGGYGAHYFVATAEDGFRVAVSVFEAAEAFSAKKVLLAYEQDGEPLRIGVRLVVPGDGLGGRSIMGVVGVEIHSVESKPEGVRPPSDGVAISGLVERPGRLDLTSLRALAREDIETVPSTRHVDEPVPSRRYAGPRLFDLLEAAGMKLDPAINEDILRKIVVARSADGYAAVIAGGEIEPRFMNGSVIVATHAADAALGDDDGLVRLVVPYDRAIARCVKGLTSLELREA